MRQCTTKVWDRYRWGSFPCSRKGVVEWDGKFYCKQHDPVKVKARQEEQTRKWDQKQSAKEHTFACVRAVESIGGDPATVGEMMELVTASLLYDQSIAGRATRGEFDLTESGATITEGDDLDTLYLNWMLKAKAILARIKGEL